MLVNKIYTKFVASDEHQYISNLFCVVVTSTCLFLFLKRLANLEAGAKDASDFLAWQTSMRQRDMGEQLAEIERRRLEGKLSHEEAILARQSLIKDNKEKVQMMKKEVISEFL